MLLPNINPKEIGIYLRTSTRIQRIEETMKSQFHFAELWLKRYGYDINQCRIFRDDGVSSARLISESQRSAGKLLLAACEAGQIKVVCFYATDRLVREARDFHEFENRLRKAGVRMISMSENLDSSNEDDVMLMGLFALFAERERAKITKRSLAGKARVAQEGKWTGGRAPYGYQIINKKLAIKEPEASVIRLLFDLYLKLQSTTLVMEEFHRRGILSPFGKEWWNTTTLPKFLRSKLYAGTKEYIFKDQANVIVECPAIVSAEKWERAQRLLDANLLSHRSFKANDFYILAGIAYCGHCGKIYKGWTCAGKLKGGITKWYRRYHHSHNTSECDIGRQPLIQSHIIEDLVWQDVLVWIQNPGETIQKLQSELKEEGTGGITSALKELRTKLKEAKRNKKRTIDFLYKEILSEEEATERLQEIRQEIKLIERQIAEKEQLLHSSESAQQYINDTQRLLERLHDTALNASELDKREIILTLIDRVDAFYDTQGRKRGGKVSVKLHSCF